MQAGSSGWADVIQWSLWALVMAGLFTWIGRSRLKPGPGGDTQLRQPVPILVLGIVGLLFFAALAVISNVFANETTTWWTTAIFVGFAVLSAWLVVSYFVERHDLSSDGLEHRSLVRGRSEVAWSDVARVSYSPGMKWFRLESSSGKVVRVSAMTVNLPAFAQHVKQYATSAQIDQESRAVLEQTEAGNPPSVWG